MAEILDQLNAAKTAAMKSKMTTSGDERAGAELRLDVLRGVLSEIERDSKDKKPRGIIAVLKSEHSKRVESAKIYGDAGEQARSTREAAEAEIVAEFLPKEPTLLELQSFIVDYISGNGLQGAGNSAMGEVMAAIRGDFESFDGKLASALVRQLLADPVTDDGPAVKLQ